METLRRFAMRLVSVGSVVLLVLIGGVVDAGPARAATTFSSLWGWSYNGDGELGNSSTSNQLSPQLLTGAGSSLVGVSDGFTHSLVLASDGMVMSAGTNAHGELGNGTTSSSTAFTPATISGIAQVAAGVQWSMALKSDGTVWTWGSNTYGQLGQGLGPDSGAHSTPTEITGLTGVVDIAAGAYFGAALKSDGTVWTWGRSNEGTLGDDSTNTATSPVQVWNNSSGCCITGVTAISAGSFQLGLLKSDGTMWMAGSNIHGALGNGTTTGESTVPVKVPGVSKVSLIAVGGSDAFAFTKKGLYSWGYNAGGLLGQGTCCSDVPSPHKVAAISGTVTSLSALGLALTSNGEVWTWGDNSTGQLANGTTSPSFDATPSVVSGISGTPGAVAEGLGGTCFVLVT